MTEKTGFRSRVRRFGGKGFFSARCFWAMALLLLLLWGLSEWLHLRDYTAILSGTSPTGEPLNRVTVGLALGYLLLYFATVLGAPVLALAGLLLGLFEGVAGGEGSDGDGQPGLHVFLHIIRGPGK